MNKFIYFIFRYIIYIKKYKSADSIYIYKVDKTGNLFYGLPVEIQPFEGTGYGFAIATTLFFNPFNPNQIISVKDKPYISLIE